jgi:hypothetical protein
MEKCCRAKQVTDDKKRLGITRWIPKARDTLSEYVIATAFPFQSPLLEGARMLGYTYAASLVKMDSV